MSNWANKHLHGLFWGYWIRKQSARDWRIHLDNYEPCYDISKTDGSRHVFQFGNIWASKEGYPFFGKPFQHYKNFAHNNWHFWDNPEIPQLMWSNPANPNGSKDWVRWVKGHILTQSKTGSGGDRINLLLREFSKGKVTRWQEIAPIQQVKIKNSRRVLVVPSSPNCYANYYSTTQQEWINSVSHKLKNKGYEVEVRFKMGRKERSNNNQLTNQLTQGNYLCTVSQHSVAAIESIMAGTPSVVTGPHPAGNLAITLDEFLSGTLPTPNQADVESWCDGLLANVRHKRELFSGEWYGNKME